MKKTKKRAYFWDSCWIALACILILLPALLPVLDYTYLPVREFDEQAFADFMDSRAVLKWRSQCAYGWIYWVTVGVPAQIFKHGLGSDALAIFWGRFYSTIAFAVSLAIIWVMARREKLPVTLSLSIVFFIFCIPTLIANATRMHPDMLQFLLLTLTISLLAQDRLRYGTDWKWAAVVFGLAIAVKFNSICAGILFLICLARHWDLKELQRAFLWGLGAFFAATLPSIGHLYQDYFRALARANLSNATNHFTSVEGLGFATWAGIWSQYGVWWPVAGLILGLACWAAWREWQDRTKAPYALFGLALSLAMYLSIAVIVRKDALWHHYMIPVAAGIGPMLIGVSKAVYEVQFSRLTALLPVLILLASVPQWPQAWYEWASKMFFGQSPEMQEAQRLVQDFQQAVRNSDRSSPLVVMYQRDVFFTNYSKRAIGIPVPSYVDGVQIDKRPLSGSSLQNIIVEHHPAFILARSSNPLMQKLPKGVEMVPLRDKGFILLEVKE